MDELASNPFFQNDPEFQRLLKQSLPNIEASAVEQPDPHLSADLFEVIELRPASSLAETEISEDSPAPENPLFVHQMDPEEKLVGYIQPKI